MSRLDLEESFHLGLEATQRGDFGSAIEYFKEYIEQDASNAQVAYLLGACYAQIGLYDRAKQQLTTALSLDPSQSTACFQLGLLHLTSGEVGLAKEAWLQLDVAEDDAFLRFFKEGLEALIGDRFADCIDLLTRGIELNNANLPLNIDMEKVIAAARAAIGTEPDASTSDAATAPNSLFLANYQKHTNQNH